MPLESPGESTRWRCTGCGNLTRFDVTRSARYREFVHVDLSGAPRVEEAEVLSEVVEHVSCRWCGAVDAVELVSRPEADSAGAEAGGAGGRALEAG